MFVRKKKNKSGSISVQIISKEGGKYKVVKTIGSSKYSKEIKDCSRGESSVNRVIELTRNMYEIRYTLPDSRREKAIYLKMDSDQQLLSDIIVNQ